MDLDALVAIDVHAHVHSSVHDRPGEHPTDALFEYFGSEVVHPTVPDLAAYSGSATWRAWRSWWMRPPPAGFRRA